MRRTRARSWFVRLGALSSVVVLLASASCKKKPPARAEYTYDVFVPIGDAELVALELEGKRLAPTGTIATGTRFDVVLPASEYVVEKRFDAIVKTSCGETKLPAKVVVGLTKSDDRGGEQRERDEAKADPRILSELRYTEPESVEVFVDGPGAVAVGALSIEPGKKRSRVPLGTCPTGRDVLVGGAKVGALDVKPRIVGGKTLPGTALIDAVGGACFMRIVHVYVDKDVGQAVAAPVPERLEGQRVYAVEIDDFLTPSPKELTTKEFMPSRSEIRRCLPAEITKAKDKAPPSTKTKTKTKRR